MPACRRRRSPSWSPTPRPIRASSTTRPATPPASCPSAQFELAGRRSRWSHVPYKGEPQAITDLIAGRVQLMWRDADDRCLAHLKDGKLRALATNLKRSSACCPTCRPWPRPACRSTRWCPGRRCTGRRSCRARSQLRLNKEFLDAMKRPEVIAPMEKQAFLMTAEHARGARRLHQGAAGGLPRHPEVRRHPAGMSAMKKLVVSLCSLRCVCSGVSPANIRTSPSA